jgi:hypothetical protein
MLPSAGPEAEESSLRLLYSKICYTNAVCKRSKRTWTELIIDIIQIMYGLRLNIIAMGLGSDTFLRR